MSYNIIITATKHDRILMSLYKEKNIIKRIVLHVPKSGIPRRDKSLVIWTRMNKTRNAATCCVVPKDNYQSHFLNYIFGTI